MRVELAPETQLLDQCAIPLEVLPLELVQETAAAMVNNKLVITTSKEFRLDLGREELKTALRHLGHAGLPFDIVVGEVKSAPAPIAKPAAQEDETTERALGHPEVQRFRELFGGEVRTIRNLKES